MFFVIATLLFVSCQSQQRKADNSGQDTVKTYYPDRSIENITLYKAGRKDGPSIDYYKDGKIKGIMIFKRDEPVDLSLYYHPNGKLGHIFYYDSLGNLTGLSKIWYDNGALRQVTGENNKDSVQSWKYFYYSGKLREEAYYRNRKKTGLWKYYTEDGDIYKTETYYDDRLLPDEKDTIIVTYYHDTIVQTGWKREYNKTGQWTSLKKETHYRNGMPDGYTVEYFESGDIKTINHYKYGLLSGKQFEYYYPNKLKQISYYKQGKKTGEWIYYSKEGNIVKKEKYRRDVLVN